MRRALQRQWTSTSIARRSQISLGPKRSCSAEVACEIGTSTEGALRDNQDVKDEQKQSTPVISAQSKPLSTEQPEFNVPIRKQLSRYQGDFWVAPETGDRPISELVKSQKRDPSTTHGDFSFPKSSQDLGAWSRFLEAVRAQRRHNGLSGAWALYLGMIENKLEMPTEGKEAAELWEHFVQTGSDHRENLSIIAEYAVKLHQRTGKARYGFYRSTVGRQLWRNPSRALGVHQLLKTHFPPDRKDFKALLRLSLHAGQESFRVLGKIFTDHPVPDVYHIVVPELCKRHMRTEATDWHFLLVGRGDLPKSFRVCRPLFQHYSHLKNDKVVEALAKSLVKRQLWFEQDVDNFVRDDKFISREIMNRALGEAHDITPMALSDGFCARLFATKFFSVAMVISGLQIMGLESLGPSSLREMVVRDGYQCGTIVQHIQMLREGGISLQQCRYNTIIENAALAGQIGLLKSMTSTDLHPDTFEDIDLQERLLATYYKMGDNEQIERTLAAFQLTTRERSWETSRANLLLRCHISLRNRPQVLSILRLMQQNRHPLAPRSSRHLRATMLSPRSSGVQPAYSREALKDLTLVINVMRMSLHAGYSMPIEAWKEILKRLGMMGHLDRYQSLALWLVDWYSRPLSPESLHGFRPKRAQTDQMTSLTNRIPTKSLDTPSELIDQESPLTARGSAQIQNRDLLKLFGKDAQQGMIAWGFQAEVKRRPNLPHPSKTRYADPQTHWQWGLKLLKELQLRGVQVNKPAVARACMLRLAQLFNVNKVSRKFLNRRAKVLNDERSKLVANFRYGAYVKGIEDIWGRDLLNSLRGDFDLGFQISYKPQRNRERNIKYAKVRSRKCYCEGRT